ncbi:MAG: hypothetical protein V3S01_01045, partial [Dehalococcoidia bacterium]
LEAFWEASHFFNEGLQGHNPKLIRTLGNHEQRIARCVSANPVLLDGLMGYHQLKSNAFGWEETDPGEHVEAEGFTLSHYYKSFRGTTGSKNPAGLAANHLHESFIFGHDHRLSFHRWRHVHIFGAGCYFEHDMPWLPVAEQKAWCRGLLELRDVHEGMADPVWHGLRSINARFG